MTTATEPQTAESQTEQTSVDFDSPREPGVMLLRWEYLRMTLARPMFLAAQGSGVLTVVAIQHFDASLVPKSLIAGATPIGMLLSPLLVNFVARSNMTVSKAIGWVQIFAAIFILAAAATNSLAGFMIGALIGVPLLSTITPLVTAMWRQMVPGKIRGKHFGRVVLVSAIFGLGTSWAIGWYMDKDAGRYHLVLVILAVLLMMSGFFSKKISSRSIENTVRNPIAILKILWDHKEFGYMSAAWMLLGISNLATLPLRVQFLAEEGHGFEPYIPEMVLYLTLVIPQLLHILTTPVWGIVFDRVNFIVTRIAINSCFALSIILFFTPSLYTQIVGSVFMGIGMGGGMVAWSLWVTKYAPPDRTADYMAVHTFLTGCRGVIGPFIAFIAADMFNIHAVVYTSVVGIVVATVMIVPLLKRGELNGKKPVQVVRPSDGVN